MRGPGALCAGTIGLMTDRKRRGPRPSTSPTPIGVPWAVTYLMGLILLCILAAALTGLVGAGLLAAAFVAVGLALGLLMCLLATRDARERGVRTRDSLRDGLRQVDIFDWLP